MAEENNISFKRQQPVDYLPPTEETQEVEETTQEDDVTEFPKFESRQEEEGKLEEPVEDNQEAPEEVAEDNNDDPKEDVFDQFFEDSNDHTPDESFTAINEYLGIEGIESKGDLKDYIQDLQAKAKQVDQVYADPEIQSHFEDLRRVSENGGDWHSYRESDLDFRKAQTEKEVLEGRLSDVDQFLNTNDINKKQEWLLYHYTQSLKMPKQMAAEKIDNMDDVDVIFEANKSLTQQKAHGNTVLSQLDNRISSLQQRKDQIKQDTINNRKQFSKNVKEALDKFQDPDGITKITQGVRSRFAKIAESESQNFQLPKALVQDLFLTDGKFDVNKAIDVYSKAMFGDKKREAILKTADIKSFRSLPDLVKGKKKVSKESQSRPPADDNSNNNNPFDGVVEPWKNRRR